MTTDPPTTPRPPRYRWHVSEETAARLSLLRQERRKSWNEFFGLLIEVFQKEEQPPVAPTEGKEIDPRLEERLAGIELKLAALSEKIEETAQAAHADREQLFRLLAAWQETLRLATGTEAKPSQGSSSLNPEGEKAISKLRQRLNQRYGWQGDP